VVYAVVTVLAAGFVECSHAATEIIDPADTSLVVFSAMDANNRFQIYSVKPDGSNKTQLTHRGNNVTPAWTPDGKRVLFASDRSGTREIHLMNEDGSAVSRIEISVVGNKLTPSMSHDLSRIAFATENPRTGHPEIWVVNADGSVPRQLTDTPKAKVGPTWSLFPRFSLDGSKILYASTQSGSSQIWIMNENGSGKRRLTNGVATDAPDANAPNWSPDGKHIVFWAGYETRYGEIWTMDADGSNPKRLTDQPAPLSSDNPAWSPDGSKIIFDTNRSRSKVEIWIMDGNGGNQRKLVGGFGAGGVMQMSWRPGLHGKGLPPNKGIEPTR
jgi:TolB protein